MTIDSKKLFAVLALFAPFSYAGNFLDGAHFTQIADETAFGKIIEVDTLASLTFKGQNQVALNFQMTDEGINCDAVKRQCTYSLGEITKSSAVLNITCDKAKSTYTLQSFDGDWLLHNVSHDATFELVQFEKSIVLPESAP